MTAVVKHGGFLYSSDSYSDDLPYWVKVGDLDQLIVPYTLDSNDMRFATAQGFNTGDDLDGQCLVRERGKVPSLVSRVFTRLIIGT